MCLQMSSDHSVGNIFTASTSRSIVCSLYCSGSSLSKRLLLGVAGNHMLIVVIHVTASDDDEEEDDDDDDEDDDD